MPNLPISEHIVIKDVSPQRQAFIRSQDHQLHTRHVIADLTRRVQHAMPALQAA